MTQQNRETLLALADRAERATGDSFDLNHDIALALGISSEPFTASLDAAMTLVPEGCGVHLCSDYSDDLAPDSHTCALTGKWTVRVYTPQHGSFKYLAATPALALCAASLRALATLDPTGEKA